MNPDFLVIGAGVAGLRAAIALAEAGSVLVAAKESLQESSEKHSVIDRNAGIHFQ